MGGSRAVGSAGARGGTARGKVSEGLGGFEQKPATANQRACANTPPPGLVRVVPATVQAARRRGGGGGRRPPPPHGPAGAPEPRERRQPPQRSDLRRALHHRLRRTNLRKHTAVSPGGGNHGGWEPGWGRGRQVHASQADHPEHESAASTTRVATSATPSAHELRRTKLRKRYRSQPWGRQSRRAGVGVGTGGKVASGGDRAGAHQPARR